MKVKILSPTLLIVLWLMVPGGKSADVSTLGLGKESTLSLETHSKKPVKELDETNWPAVRPKVLEVERKSHQIVYPGFVIPKTNSAKRSGGDLRHTLDKQKQNQKLRIGALRIQLDNLKDDITHNHREKRRAAEGVRMALDRRNKLAVAASDISKQRYGVEKDLEILQKKLSDYSSVLRTLHHRAEAARDSIDRIEDSGRNVLRQRKNITSNFLRHGLEHWVDNSLSKSVSPFVKDAVVQGTAQFVEPVLEGIERLANANEQLNTRVSAEIEDRVSIVDTPFYSGFIAYIVVLIPVVLTTSMILRLKRQILHMKPEHFTVIGNVYFGLMSLGWYTTTSLFSIDISIALRRSHSWIFQLLMTAHVLCYLLLMSLHFCVAMQTKKPTAMLHLMILLSIGLHFMIQQFHHSSQVQMSQANKTAYLVYTLLFGFILYQIAIRSVRLSFKITGWPHGRNNKPSCLHSDCLPINILSMTSDNRTRSKLHRPSDLDHVAELLNDHEGNTCEVGFSSNPMAKDEIRIAVDKITLSHKDSSSVAVKTL